MTILLDVDRVSVSYGEIEAVHDVSFAVPEGRTVALLGPNGAGKSTLLRAIAGLQPFRGRIVYDGRRIDGLAPHRIARGGLCLVPERRGVFGTLSVRENLRLASAESAYERASVERFPKLDPLLARQAATLSGGEQQMLALARAAAGDARLLTIDEPTLGLAPSVAANVYELLADLRSRRRTILLVEQLAARALRVADLVYVLAHGRIVFAGEPGELEHAPPLVERYLGVVDLR